VTSELRYTAWGEVRYASGTAATQYTFNGQYTHVDDFGLVYFKARWLDPALGRFAQADTLIPGAGDSQAWDRYAFALNNPVKYVDPDGHDSILASFWNSYTTVWTNFNAATSIIANPDATIGQRTIAGIYTGTVITSHVTLAVGVGMLAYAGGAAAAAAMTGAATAVCTDGDCTNEGSATARALGQAGEKAAGIIRNTHRIPSSTGTAAYRIPDQLLPDQGILSEVKNVSHLSLTSQLRDFLAYAQENGLTFQLITRTTTTFSQPLQKLIDEGLIILETIK